MSDDIDSLRANVAKLLESNGKHEANIETLTESVKSLTEAVTSLNATLNRGRGALWAVTCAAGTAGGIMGILVEWFRHGTH
jgi:ABC-type transporter Mla subunit MlaD